MHWVGFLLGGWAVTLLSVPAAFAQEHVIETFEHIVLSQNLTISAHHLCHDGLFIHFKSQDSCLESGDDFLCEQSLRVVPIRSVEKIYQEVGGPSLTRFYKVKTTYRYEKSILMEDGSLKPVLEEVRDLPQCEDLEIFEPGNVGSVRYIESPDEKAIFASLYRGGYRYLNTPYGNLRDIEILRDEPRPEIQDVETPFRSPQCNPLIPNGLLTLLSGELSGNGIQSFQVEFMQELSRPVFLRKRESPTEGQEQVELTYQFSCQETREI